MFYEALLRQFCVHLFAVAQGLAVGYEKNILTAPPCHRPRRVREVFRRFREVFGAKLCQNAFQTIPVNSIFGEKKMFRRFFFASDIVFRFFGPVLEHLQANGPHHQLPRNFLL